MNPTELEQPMTTEERSKAITEKFAAGFRPDDETMNYADSVFTNVMNAIDILIASGRMVLAEVDAENAEVSFHDKLDAKLPEGMHDMFCFLATCLAVGRKEGDTPMNDAKAITKAMTDPTGNALRWLVSERTIVAYDYVIRNKRIVPDDGARSIEDIPGTTD